MTVRGLAYFLAVSSLIACSSNDAAPGGSATEGKSRFYVANTDSRSISVIDHRSGRIVHTIDVGNKPHGQAPSSDGKWLYATTDGGRGEVLGVNTATNAVEWRLDVGSDMNEPHLTRDGRYLYAPDLIAANVVIVDVEARAVAGEVSMVDENGAGLIALHNTYASYDGRHMFVTAILSHAIARIDTSTRVIDRLYRLSGEPRPAAITRDDGKMYVQLSELHGFIELDLASGTETAKVEWPEPDEPPEGSENETIATKCHGLGISPDGKELWAATNLEGAVYVYSLPGLKQLARVKVGAWPNWIAFSKDGQTVYVTNTELARDEGSVSVIDTASRNVRATLPVGKYPKRIHRVDLPQ